MTGASLFGRSQLARCVFAIVIAGIAACGGHTAPKRLDIVEADAPANAELAPVIAREIARAAADHKRLLVYAGAHWCPPCVQFHAAAAAGKLDASFGDVRLLAFDVDRHGDALERAGYRYELVPLFAIPNPDGRSSGRQIEGSIKGADAVEVIAPRLRGLLDAAR